jgi:hypothetical protein
VIWQHIYRLLAILFGLATGTALAYVASGLASSSDRNTIFAAAIITVTFACACASAHSQADRCSRR